MRSAAERLIRVWAKEELLWCVPTRNVRIDGSHHISGPSNILTQGSNPAGRGAPGAAPTCGGSIQTRVSCGCGCAFETCTFAEQAASTEHIRTIIAVGLMIMSLVKFITLWAGDCAVRGPATCYSLCRLFCCTIKRVRIAGSLRRPVQQHGLSNVEPLGCEAPIGVSAIRRVTFKIAAMRRNPFGKPKVLASYDRADTGQANNFVLDNRPAIGRITAYRPLYWRRRYRRRRYNSPRCRL